MSKITYIEKRFGRDTLALIAQANSIINEYQPKTSLEEERQRAEREEDGEGVFSPWRELGLGKAGAIIFLGLLFGAVIVSSVVMTWRPSVAPPVVVRW